MRKLSAVSIGLGLSLLSPSSHALDNVEAAIIKCRTSANTTLEQVSCLETALRTMVESTGNVDWANTAAPASTSNGSAVVATTPDAVVQGLGAEQVRIKQQDFSTYSKNVQEQSVVADFAYNQNSRLILVLANGQVWKQRTGDVNNVRLKKGDRPKVIVKPGAVSGYRMEFPELNETIIVSRIQ